MDEWINFKKSLPLDYQKRLKETQGRLIICENTVRHFDIVTHEDLNNAIKAIGKRIPAKVIRKAGTNNRFCPYCGNVVSAFERWEGREVMTGMDYCKYCGQNLDWEE